MGEADAIAQGLTGWLADELGDPSLRIDGLRRTSVGYSRENWVFDAVWTAGGQTHRAPFIARRDPKGSVLETDRKTEFGVLRALEGSDIPSPRARWLDADGNRLGRPTIVMDLTGGICDYIVLNGARPAETRLAIARQLCDRLADIHRLDWQGAGSGRDPRRSRASGHRWPRWTCGRAELRRVQLEPEPELELVIAWLRRHAPDSAVTTLVHGDFKPGNVLMQGDEVTLVLDWETAHLGDPLEDIGWVSNPLRAGEQRIAGLWQPEQLIERWSAQTGFAADPAAVHWWTVLANLKQAMTVLTGKHAFADGRFDRILHEPVAIYRLLLTLIEG